MFIPEIKINDNNQISQLISNLQEIDRKIGSFDAIQPDVIKIINQANEKQILSQGRYSGNEYAALSPSYAERKARTSEGDLILIDTGNLFEIVTGGDPSNYKVTSKKSGLIADSLTIDYNLDYLIFHQQGTRNMPARPPLAFAEEDSDLVAKLIEDNVIGLF